MSELEQPETRTRTKTKREGFNLARTTVVSEEGRRRGRRIAVGKDGLQLASSDKQKVGNTTRTTRNSLKINQNGAEAGRDFEANYHDDDGNKVNEKSGVGGGVDLRGNLTGKGHKERTVKRADGSSTSTTASGQLTVGRDGAAASGSLGRVHKGKDGEVERSAEVSGGAAVDASGHLKKANLEGGFTNKGKSVSGGVEYEVSAGEVVELGEGKFAVSWRRELAGHAGAGVDKGGASANVGVEGHSVDFGVKVFDDEKAAAEFAKQPAAHVAEMKTPPKTVAGVLAMKEGERSGVEGGAGVKAGGSVPIGGGFSAGLEGQASSDHSYEVEKLKGGLVHVTVSKGSLLGGAANVGAFGAKLSRYASKSEKEWFIVEFDLATPAGKSAYAAFASTGMIVPGGARVFEKGETEQKTDGGGFGLDKYGVKAQIKDESRVTNTTTVRGGDRSFDSTGERERSIAFDAPGEFLDGHDAVEAGVHQREVNGDDVTYEVTGKVDSSKGKWSREHLADLTGTWTTGNKDAESSGKWTVSADMSKREMQHFIDRALSANFNDGELSTKGRGGLRDLQSALRKAGGDVDAQMVAMSSFVAEYGTQALEVMRTNLGYFNQDWGNSGRKQQQFDLMLEDDPRGIFRGREGRLEIEAKLRQYDAMLAAPEADLRTLYRDVFDELARQRENLTAVADRGRYTDLPHQLRDQQVARIEGYVNRLESLRATTQARLYQSGAAKREENAEAAPAGEGAASSEKARQISNVFSLILANQQTIVATMTHHRERAYGLVSADDHVSKLAVTTFEEGMTEQLHAEWLNPDMHKDSMDGHGAETYDEQSSQYQGLIARMSRQTAQYAKAAALYARVEAMYS